MATRSGGGGFIRGGHLSVDQRRARPSRPAWPTFLRAAGLMRSYRMTMGLFLGAIAFTSLAGLLPPLLIRSLIDKAIPHHDGGQIDRFVLVMLVVIVLSSLATVWQTYLSNSISQSMMLDLRNQLFTHLSGMSLSWFTANRTGETLSRVSNDVGAVQGVVSDTLGSIFGNVLTLVSTFALMLALDWRLALFSVALVPFFVLPARQVGELQRRLQLQTQQQMAALNSQMQEALSVSGALLMKTFGRQAEEAAEFSDTGVQIRDLNLRRAMAGRWFAMAIGLFGTVGPVVVYWYGGHRVITGDASLGTIVALAGFLPRLFGPTASLISANISILSSLALFERIFDYLDLEQGIVDRPGARELTEPRGEVELRDVDFAYLEEQPVLHGVTLAVPPGGFAALVGPSGAGKTTIANLVPRFYDVSAGRVMIDGWDVRDLTLASLGRCVGIVNQEPFLFHASIRENLRYAKPDATDEEVEAAARAANIHAFIARLPHSYDTLVGERGYRLSGGEKQRVAIARALLKDPAVLILDEATSSVDTITERAIQEALARVTSGRTVLAIAHRLSTILQADVIFVIDEGRVAESGTHAELLAVDGVYAGLYREQFGATPLAAGLPD